MEDYDDILTRYKRMRSATRGMNNTLVDLCGPYVEQASKALGVWVNGTIVMDIDQMPVLMDHAIYRYPRGDHNAIERLAAKHPPAPGSDAQAALSAMRKAFFSLFQVRDVIKGVGVRVTDILRDGDYFLADVSMSQTAVEGLVLASRMLPFEDFIMTAGAPLPVDAKVLGWVAANLEENDMSHEGMRNLPPKVWGELETKIIRVCLNSDGDRQIAYRDAPGTASQPALSKEPSHVGRNDPCPCGSGKKFKKCCGRQ